jgi:hypothetical protein
MGAFLWVFCMSVMAAPPDGSVDRQQLLRILNATWAEVRDVEFLYEGSIRALGRDEQGPGDFDDDFQGIFAFRHDNAASLYTFVWPADRKKPMVLKVSNLFKGRYGRRSRLPDSRPSPSSPDRVQKGVVASLLGPHSPLNFFLMPLLIELLRDESTPFESLGWEDVGGHRCLKVRLGPPGIYEKIYWLDIERGGHPLKYEVLLRSNLRMRRLDIELTRFRLADGKPCWLPVQGKTHSYVKSGGLSKTPVFEEIYHIIRGTVHINRGLSDSRFSLDWSPKPGTEGPAKAIIEFNHPPASARRPQSAQERLDRVIAEASRQTEHLEASAPSRESWIRRNPATVALVVVGIVAFGFAGYLKWRSR